MDPQNEHHPGDRRQIGNDESDRNKLQTEIKLTSIDKSQATDLMKSQPGKWRIDEDVLRAVDVMDRKLQEVRSEQTSIQTFYQSYNNLFIFPGRRKERGEHEIRIGRSAGKGQVAIPPTVPKERF